MNFKFLLLAIFVASAYAHFGMGGYGGRGRGNWRGGSGMGGGWNGHRGGGPGMGWNGHHRGEGSGDWNRWEGHGRHGGHGGHGGSEVRGEWKEGHRGERWGGHSGERWEGQSGERHGSQYVENKVEKPTNERVVEHIRIIQTDPISGSVITGQEQYANSFGSSGKIIQTSINEDQGLGQFEQSQYLDQSQMNVKH